MSYMNELPNDAQVIESVGILQRMCEEEGVDVRDVLLMKLLFEIQSFEQLLDDREE